MDEVYDGIICSKLVAFNLAANGILAVGKCYISATLCMIYLEKHLAPICNMSTRY